MLITEPNDFVAEVHDRMPVVLESKDFASWLNDDGGAALPRPAANDVVWDNAAMESFFSSLKIERTLGFVTRPISLAHWPRLPDMILNLENEGLTSAARSSESCRTTGPSCRLPSLQIVTANAREDSSKTKTETPLAK
jgi:hypothetical protein